MKNNMNEEKIIEMLLSHENRLDRIETNMATKQDLAKMAITLDKILAIVTANDQETTVLKHAVEGHDKDISEIKRRLSFA